MKRIHDIGKESVIIGTTAAFTRQTDSGRKKERLESDAERCGMTRNAFLRRLISGEQGKERRGKT